MTGPFDALWVDATYGAAGDMLLGALLDVGADLGAVRAALAGLAAAGSEPIDLQVRPVRRHGLRASQAVVTAPPSTSTRGPGEVAALVRASGLPGPVEAFALAVFDTLATAEARVHGVPADQVHFHEVGALDALADVVGCAVALYSLGLLRDGAMRQVSRIGLGSGTARTEHGRIPVPVPATLEVLAGVGAPVTAGLGDRELCTPTGAALLAVLGTGWGDLPNLTVVATGSGAGTADPQDHPNIVRVVVGRAGSARASDQDWRTDRLVVLEATVDDLDPRLWPDALDALVRAGAHDSWLTPVLMRKGRPGYVVTALTPPATVDAVFRALATTTTTLGARLHPVSRRALKRDTVVVDVDGQVVEVKRGLLDGVAVTAQPEYDQARDAAAALGRPVGEILDRARAAAGEAAPTP